MLTKEQANAVYDILAQECGAPEQCSAVKSFSERDHFVLRQTSENIVEWRFCGKLGFGGKFWINCDKWYVTCYREDETPERLRMIEAANKRLEALVGR